MASGAAVRLAIQPKARWLYLDALRNLLMMLGVVIHSAQLFRAYTRAEVELHPSNPFFDYLCAGIHVFRLPAFFLISGYVGTSVLRVRGASFFTKRRIQRIGIPFVTALFTLNILDGLLGTATLGGFRNTWSVAKASDIIVNQFAQGNLKHLWFLPVLLLYSLVLSGVVWIARHVRALSGRDWQYKWLGKAEIYLLVLPLWMVLTGAVSWRLIPLWDRLRWLQIPTPEQLILYAPFFLFGAWAQTDPDLWNNFGSTFKWYAISAIGMGAGLVLLLLSTAHLRTYTFLYVQGLLAWVLVGVTIQFGRVALDKPSVLSEQTDLAYSVYLVHHVFVTGLAVVFASIFINTFARFALIVVIAGSLSVASHQVISHVLLLKTLFNGRLPRANAHARSAHAAVR